MYTGTLRPSAPGGAIWFRSDMATFGLDWKRQANVWLPVANLTVSPAVTFTQRG